MRIHRVGIPVLLILGLILAVLSVLVFILLPQTVWAGPAFAAAAVLFFTFCIRFFRLPSRPLIPDEKTLTAAADGRVVVIERCREEEWFKAERMQVSTFMSIWNTHSNRAPVSGRVRYVHYRPGAHLVARNPKASGLNECYTLVIETPEGEQVMLRLIAGAVARRIVCFVKEGEEVRQGQEIGFIKFGSRVDLLFNPEFDLQIQIGDSLRWNRQVIARLK